MYARIQLQPHGRPFAGAEVGLEDAATDRPGDQDATSRWSASRARRRTTSAPRCASWAAAGRQFVIADLSAGRPARRLRRGRRPRRDADQHRRVRVAPARRGLPGERRPRHPERRHAHRRAAAVPVGKRWTDILVLQGPLPADAEMVEALRRSADKFDLDIVDVKPFQLTNDPRFREQSNVALMTAGADYDVVFVADTDGEFGRYVPYQTNLPRPVVGTTGLVPAAWHWAWERNGGPQVNSRFEAHADWRMTDARLVRLDRDQGDRAGCAAQQVDRLRPGPRLHAGRPHEPRRAQRATRRASAPGTTSSASRCCSSPTTA